MSDTNTPNESRVTRSGEMVTAPIDDYLLSIADSLHRVQLQLNQNKVLSVDGKSYTTYQLPKLEFELKMSIEMDTTEHKDQRSVIKAIPVNPVNTRSSNRSSTKSESVESASIIKGVFNLLLENFFQVSKFILTLTKKRVESGAVLQKILRKKNLLIPIVF